MHDILDRIGPWYDASRPFALATVVRSWNSSPRQPGASMAVDKDGVVVGSVSGGCVEGAVYDVAGQVIDSGIPELATYGIADEDALGVGLTCGGTLQIFIERIHPNSHPHIREVLVGVASRRSVAVATVIDGAASVGAQLVAGDSMMHGSLGNPSLDRAAASQAVGMLEHGRTGIIHLGTRGEQREDAVTIFVESLAPPPTMLVFGAIDFASAMVRTAKLLGYYVVVCDARPVFATRERFPEADEVVVQWPHRYLQDAPADERTAICVLTHDPKFDVPLLELALTGKASYVGAMGSRRTHEQRLRALRERGVDDQSLSRLSSPIGLDLGARTPEETAVSIAAEIIADAWKGTGQRLRELSTPIHG